MVSPNPADPKELSPELRNVQALQAKITLLRTRNAILTERIERDHREREEVRGALSVTEAELETAVLTPVPGGIDPTAWLPDEILWMILVRVLVGGTCGRVCRRWHAVRADATAKKQAWQWRWAGYAQGRLTPLTLSIEGESVLCVAASLPNTVYCGAEGGSIELWSTITNTRLRTFEREHATDVYSLVVGKDGTVYSVSDIAVDVWSGEDGSHLNSIEGHVFNVTCLAVGTDGTLYSGSHDETIRVWKPGWDGSRLIRTLDGHTGVVESLALSRNGKMYSGSLDMTIRLGVPRHDDPCVVHR